MFLIALTFLLTALVCDQGDALPTDVMNSPLGQTANFTKYLDYLRKYQYVPPAPDSSDGLLSVVDVKNGLKRLQEYGNITVTGEFDAATIALMAKPRCGVPDPVGVGSDGAALGGKLKRYAHTGGKWDKTEISYRILNTAGSGRVSGSESDDAIQRAFELWNKVTPLTFVEKTSGFADIYLKFGAGYHGDQFPFDGYGGTLAHAYPPMAGFQDLDGDVHFDDAEPYTVRTPDGINLYIVAAHEIGHALGLAHSNVGGALMQPFYQGYTEEYTLPYDDIQGIQTLYGGPTRAPDTGPGAGPTPTKSAVNPVPTVKSSGGCNSLSFKAIGYIRSELFAFKADRYWRIRSPKQLLTRTEGDELQYFWYNLPSDIDGAYERYYDQRILFFKGNQYWEYDGLTVLDGFPKGISELDSKLPTDIDAVITYNEYLKTYFFKDDMVWRFDEGTKTVDEGWPYQIDLVFGGVPSNLGAAFRYKDGTPFFVKGSQYYQFNDATGYVNPGYPRSFGEDFLGCQPDQIEGGNGASTKTPALLGIALGTFMMVLNQLW